MQTFSLQVNTDCSGCASSSETHCGCTACALNCATHRDHYDFALDYGTHRNYYYDGADARNGVACVGGGSCGDGAGDKESSPVR